MNESKKAIEATIVSEQLTLTFGNGQTLVVHGHELSHEMRVASMMHGLKQKLVDAAAMSRNPDTGRAASLDDKFQAVKEVFDRITGTNPTWNKLAGGGGGGGGGGGLLLRALMSIYGKPKDVMEEWLDQKTDAEKAALRKNPKIAAKILELQAASGKTNGIDANDLLAELEGAAESEAAVAKKPKK
jgi:frataxin-like iron-binding protein CyaY